MVVMTKPMKYQIETCRSLGRVGPLLLTMILRRERDGTLLADAC